MSKSCPALVALGTPTSPSRTEDGVEAPAPAAVAAELQAIARELMDAVASGGREAWERRLAPQVSYVDPDGALKDRAAVLAEMQPLPSGMAGRIELTEPALTLSGDTAILTYRALETEHVFGQTLRAAYRVSDVYVRREGRWLLLGSQATRLAPAALPPDGAGPGGGGH